MGKDAKPKSAAKGGSKSKKSKPLSSLYTISGDKISKNNRHCPKCGPGMFLGKHSNRLVCGKCKYVEFTK
jgi:small subunit ribosomal protein S27Ae